MELSKTENFVKRSNLAKIMKVSTRPAKVAALKYRRMRRISYIKHQNNEGIIYEEDRYIVKIDLEEDQVFWLVVRQYGLHWSLL